MNKTNIAHNLNKHATWLSGRVKGLTQEWSIEAGGVPKLQEKV
jgi:hypothetical protein